MKLYHGSNVIISDINLDKCRHYKDFGKNEAPKKEFRSLEYGNIIKKMHPPYVLE